MNAKLTRTSTGFPHLILNGIEIPITEQDYDKLKREVEER